MYLATPKSNKRKKDIPRELIKYYNQRYYLFSLYDRGIQIDNSGWYSVTPECIAQHIAKKSSSRLVVDAFCGIGGNAIQYAKTSNRVIAIDIDKNKIEIAKNNARVYGVEDRIEWIVADYMEWIATTTQVIDVIFLSPPWGGIEYSRKSVMKLEEMDINGVELYLKSKSKCNRIVYYLPRNICINQVSRVMNRVEIEQNYVKGKLKTITCYTLKDF